MLTYAEIYTQIVQQLEELTYNTSDVIMFDEQIYNNSITCGIEPTHDMLWPSTATGDNNAIVMAQCFAGIVGEYGQQVYEEILGAMGINETTIDAVMACVSCRIAYYPSNMTAVAVQRGLSLDQLSEFTLHIVAHERRHSVQREDMFDVRALSHQLTTSSMNVYENFKHELDANAFATAVVKGHTTLEEVATWKHS